MTQVSRMTHSKLPRAHHHWSGTWAQTLSPEQRATVTRIRKERNGGVRATNGSHGWTVYMTPTVGPAKYLELRHHMSGGRVARWVIERDGTVSSTNLQGQSSQMVAA